MAVFRQTIENEEDLVFRCVLVFYSIFEDGRNLSSDFTTNKPREGSRNVPRESFFSVSIRTTKKVQNFSQC